MSKQTKQTILLLIGAILCLCVGAVFAAGSGTAAAGGIGTVASTVKGNLSDIAKLITAGAYVAGFGFAVAAIVKFKAHKDNPTQIPLGQPVVFLFVGAALIFAPSVFKASGITLFGGTGKSGAGTISGMDKFT